MDVLELTYPRHILDFIRRKNEIPEKFDEDKLEKLRAECEFENRYDDGVFRDISYDFQTLEDWVVRQQKMQAATPEQRQAVDAEKICDAHDEETPLKKSEQMQAATPEQRQAADAVKKNVIAKAIQLLESTMTIDARHFDYEETSLMKSEQMQAATLEQWQAADAVKKNVIAEAIQLLESTMTIDARHVDDEETSLKKSVQMQQAHEQQETKGKLTRYMPDSADAGPSKKFRYAHKQVEDNEMAFPARCGMVIHAESSGT